MKKAKHFTSYEYIADDIREKIEKDIYEPEQRLPSVVELCNEYNASDSTIRKSLEILKKEGYVYSKRRVGLFVSSVEEKKYLLQFNEFESLKVAVDRCEISGFEKIQNRGKIPDARFMDKGAIICHRKFFSNAFPVMYKIDYLLSKANVSVQTKNAESWIKEMDMVLEGGATKKKIDIKIIRASESIRKEMILSDDSVLYEVKREYYTNQHFFMGFSLIYIASYDINFQIREK